MSGTENEHKKLLDAVRDGDFTALRAALDAGIECALALIEAGADSACFTVAGATLLDHAKEQGLKRVVSAIEQQALRDRVGQLHEGDRETGLGL